MIFSILQVSRGRKRLLTASFRHLSNVVYCEQGHCLETVKFNGFKCHVLTTNVTVKPVSLPLLRTWSPDD